MEFQLSLEITVSLCGVAQNSKFRKVFFAVSSQRHSCTLTEVKGSTNETLGIVWSLEI